MKIGLGLLSGEKTEWDPRTHQEIFCDLIEIARAAEDAGFDSVWLSEHHFYDDAHLSSVLPMAAAIASVTKKIEIGTAIALAPFYDPIRLAEDAVTVDQISAGRFSLGLGLGYAGIEFEGFGINPAERSGRLEELISVLKLAWQGERFSFQGNYYKYQGVRVLPRPVRKPHLPILLAGMVPRAIERAGRLADGFIAPNLPPETLRQRRQTIEKILLQRGYDRQQFLFCALKFAFVTYDSQMWEQIQRPFKYVKGNYQREFALQANKPIAQKKLVDLGDERGDFFLGTPDECRSFLRHMKETVGEDCHIILRLYLPGLAKANVLEAIKLMGSEVLPSLRSDSVARTSAAVKGASNL